MDIVEETKKRIIEGQIKKALTPADETKYYEVSHNRKLLGNPPGTGNTIGDQLSWEILLHEYADNELTIITNDDSWKNKTDETKIHPFLKQEWEKRTKKKLHFYLTLGRFINEFTKKDKISDKEIWKEEKRSSFVEKLTQLTQDKYMGTIPYSASQLPSSGASISTIWRAPSTPSNLNPTHGNIMGAATLENYVSTCSKCGRILPDDGYSRIYALCSDCRQF